MDRRVGTAAIALAGLVGLVLVALIIARLVTDEAEPPTAPRSIAASSSPSPTRTDNASPTPSAPGPGALAEALSVVPLEATTVTVTDWDAIRARLGVPDLTSQDLMSDRRDFWLQAESPQGGAVLLTDGLLREDNSTLMLDHDVTQDDVDWEARWTGPDGPGYALRMRPDQDMASLQDAVDAEVGPLAGATVLAEYHLVVEGVGEGAEVWATDPLVATLTGEPDQPVETAYLRRGCVPFEEALGPDASFEDQDAVLADHDIRDFEPLAGVALTYADTTATAWLGPDRTDLGARAALLDAWPTLGSVGPVDGWASGPEIDEADPDAGVPAIG